MTEHTADAAGPEHADDQPPHLDDVWLRIKDHAGDSFEEHADRIRKAFEDARDGDGLDWTGYVSDFWRQVASDTTQAMKNTLDLWSAYGSQDRG